LLRELRSLPFLAEVGPLSAFRGVTPLFQRDPSYREVYRTWQALRAHPFIAFDSSHFAIPIADLPHLYERWCALEIVGALLALGGEVREQRLVVRRREAGEEDELEFSVELAEQVPLLVIQVDSFTLTLRYQPRYRPPNAARAGALGSLDRHTHVPDLAIEVGQPGATSQVLVLDAKYRLDAEGRGLPPDALADGYTYLGAIGRDGTRATLGALLIYPGTGMPERYSSGVGVLPLLPGRGAQLAALLASWLGLQHEFPLAKHKNV
jgi:large subunit ribosomal protein MRP49